MTRFSALAVLACSLAAVGEGHAETVTTRITREKPGDHLHAFTVKVERFKERAAGEVLEFTVTVKPTPANTHPLSRRAGTLSVYDGKTFVSSCEVRATERRGERTYSFRVAAKYAERSSFTFAETPDAEVESGGFCYWFYLKDFVDPK